MVKVGHPSPDELCFEQNGDDEKDQERQIAIAVVRFGHSPRDGQWQKGCSALYR